MVSPAKRKSNNKWDKENMVVLSCKVRKEYADRVRACCAANGDTVNSILREALDAYLKEKGERGN
jgi:hypothetical protein|nr:MAG TPA: plasmid partition protein ParG-helix-helix, dimer, DNA binding, CELL [Caudoviricetes sp.]